MTHEDAVNLIAAVNQSGHTLLSDLFRSNYPTCFGGRAKMTSEMSDREFVEWCRSSNCWSSPATWKRLVEIAQPISKMLRTRDELCQIATLRLALAALSGDAPKKENG